MALNRPAGRPRNDRAKCPTSACEQELEFDWEVVPPSEASLPMERERYGEALHPAAPPCQIARVGIDRSDADQVIPIEWFVFDGDKTTRSWSDPAVDFEE